MVRWVVDVLLIRGRMGPTAYNLQTNAARLVVFFTMLAVVRLQANGLYTVLILVPMFLVVLYFEVACAGRRLHDCGRPADQAVGLFVPFYNISVVGQLGVTPGDTGDNAYGAPPGGRVNDGKPAS